MEPTPWIEPYRKDPDAWDWKIISLVIGMFGNGTLERLLGALLLVACGAVLFAAIFAASIGLRYLSMQYRAHAFRPTRTGRIIQASLPVSLLLGILLSGLYYDDYISWGIWSNSVSFIWVLFTLTMVWASRQPSVPPFTRPSVLDYLNSKSIQP